MKNIHEQVLKDIEGVIKHIHNPPAVYNRIKGMIFCVGVQFSSILSLLIVLLTNTNVTQYAAGTILLFGSIMSIVIAVNSFKEI